MAKRSNIKTITPMYAVGDWVVDERSGKTKQIITVDKTLQTYYFNDCTFIEFQLESQLHLWSIFDAHDGWFMVNNLNNTFVEYTRTDVVTEKVCEWLSDNLQTIVDVECTSVHHVETLPVLGSITLRQFLNKFRKEIKYLFD